MEALPDEQRGRRAEYGSAEEIGLQIERICEMVTIKGYREDTCIWCDRKTEGVEADFGGLKGFLCRADFWRALRVRSERKEKSESAKPSSPANR